jgi:hypothetical protein
MEGEEIKKRTNKEPQNAWNYYRVTKENLSKTDTSHRTAESVTPPLYNLTRNGKFDLQVVTCQQEFWVTWIPEGLQYIISYGGNSSNDDITEGDA